MKVEKTTTNYVSSNGVKAPRVRRTPSFKGSPVQQVATEAVKAAEKFDMEKTILNLLPAKKAFEIMDKFKAFQGEAGGILITALGTGIVAPIVIGTNPLVKAKPGATEEEKQEVKNKKWYTAWRQPISAILAIFFQLGAQKPIDKVLDKVYNDPKYSQYVDLYKDQSAVRGESYVKKLVKADMDKKSMRKSTLFDYIKDYKGAKARNKKYNEAFKEAVANAMNSDIEKVAQTIRQEGVIKVGERVIDNPTLAELLNRTIDDSLAVARKLRINEKSLAHYTNKAELLMMNEERIREVFKNVPQDSASLETYLKKALANEQNKEVQEIINDVLKKPKDMRLSRIERTLERIDYIADMCGGKGKYTPDKYLQAMSERNGVLDNIITKLNLNKIKDLKNVTKEQIQDAISQFIKNSTFDKNNELYNSILHDTQAFDCVKKMEDGKLVNPLEEKVYKDIAKAYKKFVSNNYKAVNQLTKVMVGVGITLPITCTALNIIYPRFMALVFPEMSGIKKSPKVEEGGAK